MGYFFPERAEVQATFKATQGSREPSDCSKIGPQSVADSPVLKFHRYFSPIHERRAMNLSDRPGDAFRINLFKEFI